MISERQIERRDRRTVRNEADLERTLAGLVLAIAVTNFFNRISVATQQIAGAGW